MSRGSFLVAAAAIGIVLEAPHLIGVGPLPFVLASESANDVVGKRAYNNSITQIDDDDPIAAPPRACVGRYRDLAIAGDFHHIARSHQDSLLYESIAALYFIDGLGVARSRFVTRTTGRG
ncbi:MAG: hypothetical protein V3V01_01535 [Acidimicrobiales bacterium]